MNSKTYAFVDASNIIYGTRDEGWKVDFKKLIKYLEVRIFANAKRTAREIKKLKGIQFNDLGVLKETIKRK